MDLLKECCDKRKLGVNKEKTQIMVKKDAYLSRRGKWFYEGNQIEVVNSCRYLGFTFTTMHSAKLGTSHLAAKGKEAVYILCKVFQNCKEMTQNKSFTIFQSKVQSILLFSTEIWGLQILQSIEKVHMLECKRFLGVPIRTPNTVIYGEFKIPSICEFLS